MKPAAPSSGASITVLSPPSVLRFKPTEALRYAGKLALGARAKLSRSSRIDLELIARHAIGPPEIARLHLRRRGG